MLLEHNGFRDHVNKIASDESGEKLLIASDRAFYPSLVSRNTEGEYSIRATEATVPCMQHITAIDVSPDGRNIVIASDQYLHTNSFPTQDGQTQNFERLIKAVRFHPSNNSILVVGTPEGVYTFNVINKMLLQIIGTSTNNHIECLALSGDGKTIAAGSENGLYLINSSALENSLTPQEHFLLFALDINPQNNKTQLLKESPGLMKIFASIKQSYVRQNLIKLYGIDYKILGFEQCTICKDRCTDKQLECKHSFCSDCIEVWKEEKGKQASCPLCRVGIAQKDTVK